ncbi:MAG: hypothetical protein HYU86_07550 [Chloroflexi bacterium]|nr:hypothetical protein [Chloroflexota bacterium]
MSRLPRLLRVYILLVVVAGVVTLAFSIYSAPPRPDSNTVLLASAYALMTVLVGRFPLQISPKSKVSMATATIFGSFLLFDTPIAIMVAAYGIAVADIILRRRWSNILFDVGQSATVVGLSSLMYHSLQTGNTLLPLSSTSLVAIPAAAIALYVGNTLAVSLAISLQTRQGLGQVWLSARKQDWTQEGALYVIGLLGAILSVLYPWSFVLMAVPVVVIYRSFQASVSNARLNEQLKAQMEELKRTQVQLVQSAKMASLGTLAAGVAHEINNPIFAIAGRAELLLDNADVHLKSPKAKQHLTTIYDMTKRVADIVQGLLAFSREKDKGIELNVNGVLDETLSLVAHSLHQERIVVVKEYGRNLPPVTGRGNRLQQAFLNIIINARDAMPQGGTIFVTTGVDSSGQVIVRFADTGTGIPKEIREQVFDPFFTTKEIGKGTGLGLFITQGIVEEHSGRIALESPEGEGTIFTIYLPPAHKASPGEEPLKGGVLRELTAPAAAAKRSGNGSHPEPQKVLEEPNIKS